MELNISPELLARAKALGPLAPEDLQAPQGSQLPVWSIVMPSQPDAFYTVQVNGQTLQAGRIGHFRRKAQEGNSYADILGPLVVLDSRTSNVRFSEGKPVCRGLSTEGLWQARCTYGAMGPGFDCDACPFNRWRWEEQKGAGDATTGPNGEIITKETLCGSQLALYCWEPETDDRFLVQFAAGAFAHWKGICKSAQGMGIAIHSCLGTLTTEKIAPKVQGRVDSYVPNLKLTTELTPELFERARELRAQIAREIREQAKVVKLDALPPAAQPALPSASAFSSVPTLPAPPHDTNDPFSNPEV